jgi:hypothetical protein
MKGMNTTPDELRATVKAFGDIGADELILNPTTDEIDDVRRLADIVL